MNERKSHVKIANKSGITLVSLVVTIIIMLILAGVSINAAIGENGIVTRAAEASRQSKIAHEKEELDFALTNLNIDAILGDDDSLIKDVAQDLLSRGVIDGTINRSSGQVAVGRDNITGERYFFGVKGENTYKISKTFDGMYTAELTSTQSGGDINGGYNVVTEESFNTGNDIPDEDKGKFRITSNAEIVFMDSISGELSIFVKAGVHAIVGIYADIALTNENLLRSAVDIEPTGVLDVYIGEREDGAPATLTVNSGFAVDAQGRTAGKGGYAGIHVPDGASLILNGIGNVVAYGGDASNGSTAAGNTQGGGTGGGGAGAGIGGCGGNGGAGSGRAKQDGFSGEDCGTVIIKNAVTVYAYGGGGGEGATSATSLSGGGGGGYPAAGIGGGGAGAGCGTGCCCGGGGYSGGGSKFAYVSTPSDNGLAGQVSGNWNGGSGNFYNTNYNGGGYFLGPEDSHFTRTLKDIDGEVIPNVRISSFLGGMGNSGAYNLDHRGSDGGTAGSGGNITVSSLAKVYAYNGNRFTDGTSYDGGNNELPIYLQKGYYPTKYKYLYTERIGGNGAMYINTDVQITDNEKTNVELSGYINPILLESVNRYVTIATSGTDVVYDLSIQGVGSGAGYVEISNGTYTIDSSLN